MTRNYTTLFSLPTIRERYEYLKLRGTVGTTTFGWDRYFNQRFYHSAEWKQIRNTVILRDHACDLGVVGYEIQDKILIHHMNPIWVEDLHEHNQDILNPEFLISVSHRTHQAIHYGDNSLLPAPLIERQRGDTKLW
jgi:hypothetical protein